MIIVTGQLTISPSQLQDMSEQIASAMQFARADAGCIAYSMAIEDAKNGRVIILEKWEDEASLKAHLSQPEVESFVELLQRVVTDIDLKMYDAQNERVVADVGAH